MFYFLPLHLRNREQYDIDTIKHQIIAINAKYAFEIDTLRYRRSKINYFKYEPSGRVGYPLCNEIIIGSFDYLQYDCVASMT